jgi:thiamine-monophosphate kinase
MNINDIGEFGFIRRIMDRYKQNIPEDFAGIGDDCAIISGLNNGEYAISTDMLVEGTHFVVSQIGPYALGRKSLSVNLSDLAAAGAVPCGVFLSLGIPDGTSLHFLDRFMDGFMEYSQKFSCPLLGGDTTMSKLGLVINVTVVGKRIEQRRISRAGALPGDVICVTGVLGDSGAGLDFVLHPDRPRSEAALQLVERHHNPYPRVEEGIYLASMPYVHAMMDISDGVASDLKHILSRSQVSATIFTEKLPISDTLRQEFGSQPSKIVGYALNGGEDYELLLTVASAHFADLSAAFRRKFGIALHAIGNISNNPEHKVFYVENGANVNSIGVGWNHFTA